MGAFVKAPRFIESAKAANWSLGRRAEFTMRAMCTSNPPPFSDGWGSWPGWAELSDHGFVNSIPNILNAMTPY